MLIGACSVRSATGIPHRALVALLYRSGLRVSEIVALQTADVDLKKHSVRVLHGKGNKATTRGFPNRCDRPVDLRKFTSRSSYCRFPPYLGCPLQQHAAKPRSRC